MAKIKNKLKTTPIKTLKKDDKKIYEKGYKKALIDSADAVPKVKDVPLTKGHLDEFRAEISSRMTSVELALKASIQNTNAQFKNNDARFDKIDARFAEVDARFDKIEARFAEVDARFDKIDARFAEVDARFDKIEARFTKIDEKFESLDAKIHKILVKVEEQNDRNKIVLEGLANLFDRQDRFEKSVDDRIKNIENVILK